MLPQGVLLAKRHVLEYARMPCHTSQVVNFSCDPKERFVIQYCYISSKALNFL